MANSYVEYTGNGSTTAYAIPFDFIDSTHVTATVNGSATTITIAGTTATFSSAPADSSTIRITRNSSQTTRLVDYTQPSTLTEEDLDTDSKQAFFISQEAVDTVGETIRKNATTAKWDAVSTAITNVTDPTNDQDAATKAYVASQLGTVATSAAAAATSATASATSATASASSATAAASSASTASGHVTTASNYAVKVDGAVTGSDYSSKAWAVGGTGVTDTSSAGAAKEWATETSGNVDGTDYSAKEYAQGTQASTGGSAKSWAQDTDQVDGASTNDRSAKNWAQGSSMTGSTLGGSAKDWAQTTGGTVDGSGYAAKEWALGTTVADGSAKDWATQAEDSAVTGSSYSALHHAAKASASATAASNSATAAAQGQLYSTVSNKTGDFTATTGNDGTYFICDTSGGNITVTLPTIGSNEGLRLAFQKSSGSNSLILDPQSTDTVNGSTSNYTVSENSEVVLLVADDASPDNWVATIQSQTVAGDGLTKTGSTMAIDYTRDQAWTGSQRSTPVVDNDGSFDMNAGNNFTCTPSGNFALTFTNITSGQGGLVYLVNTGGHTVTKDSAVKADANFLATVTAAGTYLVAYYSPDGTSVVVTNSLAVT